MEIEVLVDADPVVDNSQKRYRAASAFFTYVSLNQEGKPLPVPQLVVSVPSCPKQGRTQACDHGLCPGLVKSREGVPCKMQAVRWANGSDLSELVTMAGTVPMSSSSSGGLGGLRGVPSQRDFGVS